MQYIRLCTKCSEEARVEVSYSPFKDKEYKVLGNGLKVATDEVQREHLACRCAVCGYTWKSLTFDNKDT